MPWEEPILYLRVANVILASGAIMLMGSLAFRQWSRWNVRAQSYWFGLTGWIFLGLYYSCEALITQPSPTPRSFILMVVLLVTVRSALISRNLDDREAILWLDEKETNDTL